VPAPTRVSGAGYRFKIVRPIANATLTFTRQISSSFAPWRARISERSSESRIARKISGIASAFKTRTNSSPSDAEVLAVEPRHDLAGSEPGAERHAGRDADQDPDVEGRASRLQASGRGAGFGPRSVRSSSDAPSHSAKAASGHATACGQDEGDQRHRDQGAAARDQARAASAWP
jgi:hypothetical protein